MCQKCRVGNRRCVYSEAPSIIESSPAALRKSEPSTALTRPERQEDKRALRFFLERTAPVMSAFGPLTKSFWQLAVPQLAASAASVRHIAIAVASRQEKNIKPTTIEAARLQLLEKEHYTSGLSCITKAPNFGDVEILLVSSALFIAYGNFEDLEQQSAQDLMHLSSGIKILIERASSPVPRKESEIIDQFIQPMFVRLELMLSVYMVPLFLDRYSVDNEPVEPVLPRTFASVLHARQSFVDICCYRHHASYRHEVWNCRSFGFLKIRMLLLGWYHLVVAFQAQSEAASEVEQQRIAIMLSQFRVLFVAFIYSGRPDLHLIENHLSPSRIQLRGNGQMTILYELPERYLTLLPELDWESKAHEDPLQVRLWPIAQVAPFSETTASMSLTFTV